MEAEHKWTNGGDGCLEVLGDINSWAGLVVGGCVNGGVGGVDQCCWVM